MKFGILAGAVGGVVGTVAVVLIFGLTAIEVGMVQANADAKPGRLELWVAGTSLAATLRREAPTYPNPITATDQNLTTGVKLYGQHCAICHGTAAGAGQLFAVLLRPWAFHHPVCPGRDPEALLQEAGRHDRLGARGCRSPERRRFVRCGGLLRWAGRCGRVPLWPLAAVCEGKESHAPDQSDSEAFHGNTSTSYSQRAQVCSLFEFGLSVIRRLQ